MGGAAPGNQQTLGRSESPCQNSEIPPTEVGGWFKSGLQTAVTEFLNPTHGSGWIVQIPPVMIGVSGERLDLNYPPTAVGGIPKESALPLVGRI
jgi:hypothetical protein